jgi:hypothetical protein
MLVTTQGCWPAVTAATADIDDLKLLVATESDKEKYCTGIQKIPLLLQPYWQGIIPFKGRPAECIGPFAGALPVSPTSLLTYQFDNVHIDLLCTRSACTICMCYTIYTQCVVLL